MPSMHLSWHYHLVFSTKNREPQLSPTHLQRVHEYISDKGNDCFQSVGPGCSVKH